MEHEKILAYVGNGDGGIIVKTGVFGGKRVVDVRKYYRKWDDVNMQSFLERVNHGEVVMDGLLPTKKGVMLTEEQFVTIMQEGYIPLYEKIMKCKLEMKDAEVKSDKTKSTE
jgi:hypothetical protein